MALNVCLDASREVDHEIPSSRRTPIDYYSADARPLSETGEVLEPRALIERIRELGGFVSEDEIYILFRPERFPSMQPDLLLSSNERLRRLREWREWDVNKQEFGYE